MVTVKCEREQKSNGYYKTIFGWINLALYIIIFKLDAIVGTPSQKGQTHTHTSTTSNIERLACSCIEIWCVLSGATCETSWSKYFNHIITWMNTAQRRREREGSGKVLFLAYHVIRIWIKLSVMLCPPHKMACVKWNDMNTTKESVFLTLIMPFCGSSLSDQRLPLSVVCVYVTLVIDFSEAQKPNVRTSFLFSFVIHPLGTINSDKNLKISIFQAIWQRADERRKYHAERRRE